MGQLFHLYCGLHCRTNETNYMCSKIELVMTSPLRNGSNPKDVHGVSVMGMCDSDEIQGGSDMRKGRIP